MVASGRDDRSRFAAGLRAGGIAFAYAMLLAGCDLLMTILPQGGANAFFAYADPRLEKSARIEGLSEVFNIAAAPDGRVFAIARDGVAEFTADLKHVRTYYADAAEGIQRREDGGGPEEWQVTSGPLGIPVLFATRRGTMLFLFSSGGTILSVHAYDSIVPLPPESDWLYGSVISQPDFYPQDGSDFNQYLFSQIGGTSVRGLGADWINAQLYGVEEQGVLSEADGLRSYAASFGTMNGGFGPITSYAPITNFTIPRVRSDFAIHRLYPRAGIIALVMGYNSYIGEVESSTFIFDRALGGEPIARFDLRGAITAASDTALYAITGDHDEEGGWIHKLRFKP